MSSYLSKELALSTISDKCGSNNEKILKDKESIEILKVLDLVDNINESYIEHQINMKLFPAYSGWAFLGLLIDEGGGTKRPPSLKSVPHMKLGTVIPYQKKIKKNR